MFDNGLATKELTAAQAKIQVLEKQVVALSTEVEVLRRDLAVANTKIALQAENAILKGKLEATLFQVSLREALAEQRMFSKVLNDDRDQELVTRTMGHLAPLLANTQNGELRTLTVQKEEK